MSIEINDLDNVEQEVNQITDLSTNEIEVIHIDGVSNIPLIKGDVGEKGETGPANCLQIGIVEEGDEAFRTYANYSQFFAFENNREDTKENNNSNISTATYTRYVKVNSSLNVRSGAGINYSYIRSLYNGNKV